MGSHVERGSTFGNFSDGGNSGFLINSFDPELNYGTSDFDLRHQVNINWLSSCRSATAQAVARTAPAARQRCSSATGRSPA